MNRIDRSAPFALTLAILLGFLADRLFPHGVQGPGFALWMALLGAAAVLVARRSGNPGSRAVAGWSAVSLAAATALVFRDSEVAFLAMWLVLFASASMVILRSAGLELWQTRPLDHVLGLMMVPARAAAGVVPLVSALQPPADSSRRRLLAVARGALIAVPLLFVFGALFASADAGFDRALGRLATWWSQDFFAHLFFAVAFTWISAGLLSALRARRLPETPGELRLPRLGREETAVVFGLLALLFLTFVGFQLGYLFGGRSVVEATAGLSMAEYARRGFFEMMVVGIGTILVLLVGDATTTARNLFRALAAVLIGCVLVMLGSAAQRMMIYTDTFGLSVDRITAAMVMAWVATVLILFAATVLRERPRPFASGALIAGILAAFALIAINPDAMAARSNLDRAAAGMREADADFLGRLGADAAPEIVRRIGLVPESRRCDLWHRMEGRWLEPEGDWRQWSAPRAAARRALLIANSSAAAPCP